MDPETSALIEEIVQWEWEFFQGVNNVGGPASCQSMPATFAAMRRAQYSAWSPEAVAGWHNDLEQYRELEVNPLTLKYGYMMASTHPDEYEQIKDSLPEIPEEKQEIIELLMAIEVAWAEDLRARYPHFSGTGRPIHSSEDTAEQTSVETYGRGEFSTYSMRTLALLLETYRDALERGENLNVTTAEAQAKAYGYASIDEAERAIAEGRMGSVGLDG